MQTNDLISRSALLKEVRRCKEAVETCANHDYMVGYASALSGVEGQVADAPAVDAAPVRHGRWEYVRTDRYNGEFAVLRCSNCGHTNYAIADYIRNGKWCPYCGCKMDAEVNNDGV